MDTAQSKSDHSAVSPKQKKKPLKVSFVFAKMNMVMIQEVHEEIMSAVISQEPMAAFEVMMV